MPSYLAKPFEICYRSSIMKANNRLNKTAGDLLKHILGSASYYNDLADLDNFFYERTLTTKWVGNKVHTFVE